MKNLSLHESNFYAYTAIFSHDDPVMAEQYRLKELHTKNVLFHAKTIALHEPCFNDERVSRSLLLAALYHDIGRFEQIKRYRTFADAVSCNHGLLGLKILRKLDFLKEEVRYVRKKVAIGVALHNRFAIPQSLEGDNRNILLALRDADKLDIIRILALQVGKNARPDPTVVMHLEDKMGMYSPIMYEKLGEKGGLSFFHMRYLNDFRLLLCHWVGELFFQTSRDLLKESNHLQSIIAGMEGLPDVQRKATEYVNSKLDKKA